jgi:hypothetical protein
VKEHLIYKYARVGNRFFPPAPPAEPSSCSASSSNSNSNSNTVSAASGCAFDLWEVEDVDPGRILAYEGDAPASVYYLSEGQVRLHRSSSSQQQQPQQPQQQPQQPQQRQPQQDGGIVLGPGTLLGARAAVLGEPERFTMVTDKAGPCVFLKLGPHALKQHLEAHPAVRASLETLCRRRRTPLATLLECPEGRKAFAAHLAEEFTLEHLTCVVCVAACFCFVVAAWVTCRNGLRLTD